MPTKSSPRSAPGGMGEVYCARDTKPGREIAVKILPADVFANAVPLARFEQEPER